MSEQRSAMRPGLGALIIGEWLAIHRRVRQLRPPTTPEQGDRSPNRRTWSAPAPTVIGDGQPQAMRMADEWICVFEGRAKGRARAVFATEDQARQFAERHARDVTRNSMPLKWEDAGEAVVLTTQLGEYVVAPVGSNEFGGA